MMNVVAGSRFKCLPLFVLLGAGLGTLAAAFLPGLALGEEGPHQSPTEVIADAVLIDAHCRDYAVDMGALFRYAGQHGVASSDILPLGAMRKTFEVTLTRRFEGVDPETFCQSAVAREAALAPGVVKTP